MTEDDATLRRAEVPEREAQRVGVNRKKASERELNDEAQWILRRGRIFRIRGVSAARLTPDAIVKVLNLLCNSHFEASYIAHYERDSWADSMTSEHLWAIAEEDALWFALQQKRDKCDEQVATLSQVSFL